MGLNLLDFQFRVERRFKIRIEKDWTRSFWESVRREEDLSLQDFYAVVLRYCAEQGVTPPDDGMALLIHEAEQATGKTLVELGPRIMLRRDIAPGD